MSIGPKEKQQLQMTNRMEQVQIAAKKTIIAYFERPWHYLFFTGVLYMVVSLALGHRLIWEFYLIIIIIGAFKFHEYTKKEKLLIANGKEL